MWPLVIWIIHFASCFQGSSVLAHVSELHSCLWLNNGLSNIEIPHFVYPFIGWWKQLGLLLPLAVVNHAAVHIGGQVSVWVSVFKSFRSIPGCRLAGSHDDSVLRNCRTILCSVGMGSLMEGFPMWVWEHEQLTLQLLNATVHLELTAYK